MQARLGGELLGEEHRRADGLIRKLEQHEAAQRAHLPPAAKGKAAAAWKRWRRSDDDDGEGVRGELAWRRTQWLSSRALSARASASRAPVCRTRLVAHPVAQVTCSSVEPSDL